MMYFTFIQTPIGQLRLRASETAIIAVDHMNKQTYTDQSWVEDIKNPLIQQAITALNLYFKGRLTSFTIPIAPSGTIFQQKVWQALQVIPYGETASYSEIAQAIDNPKAFRAVGAANSKNPISIFIPCHRIIGKNDSLTGYAGGLNNKSYLLDLERKYLPSSSD